MIDSKNISAILIIEAPNVVIERSYIHGSPSDYAGVDVRSGSLRISDSTITGADNGIQGDNYTARRVNVTGLASDGFKLGNNVHIDQAWCHDMNPGATSHPDCVQMQSGVINSSVTNSWLVGARNSAIIIKPDLGPSADGPVTIDGNVLGGGNYTLYCLTANHGEYVERNITVTNNSFLRDARYGPQAIHTPVTASNNVWFDTGESIGGPLN